MTQETVLRIFEQAEAVHKVHRRLSSGLHTDTYIRKHLVFTRTDSASLVCGALARKFASHAIEVVVAPAVGATVLGHLVASYLHRVAARKSGRNTVRSVWADKDPDIKGGFVLRDGFEELVRGKRALLVEDVLTTGHSLGEVGQMVRRSGGEVVAAGSLWNRGSVKAADLNVPELLSLINVELTLWLPEECPLCKEGQVF